ncbi:cell division protein FtsL [Gymnodinialimonas sp. 2305UL16-5]|uniref:cell division protein FtsL n=1 Tax=Gymnodinialimonas mytili TaxID=3126503 RepID=UPI0030A89999
MRFTTILAALAVIGLGYWAYHQTIQTQMAMRDVERLERAIGAEHERLSVLRAEWAYLNRPDRLRELAQFNFERLGLLPLRPDQFGEVAQIPYPRPVQVIEELLLDNASTGGGSSPEVVQ